MDGWTCIPWTDNMSTVMRTTWSIIFVLLSTLQAVPAEKLALPLFSDLTAHYPGYHHHGGKYNNHHLLKFIGINENQNLLLHDTSALRFSYTLNKIGNKHSLGTELIRLSKYGRDSVEGREGLQYIYLPIAYGPYLADKYGYPTISKLHQQDPIVTEHNFWGKQGILRVITYTKHGSQPKGHVALWDCNHFYQSKDWIKGHSLVTVEFWESPDSNCTGVDNSITADDKITEDQVPKTTAQLMSILQSTQSLSSRQKALKNIIVPMSARHSRKKLLSRGMLQPLQTTS